MKKGRVLRVILFLFLFYFLILSPISFHANFNKVTEIYSKDKKYKAVQYNPLPFSPFVIYQLFSVDGPLIYIVLYDENEVYIGQTSPFYFLNGYDLNPILFVFPGDNLDSDGDNFDLLIDGYGDAFKINIHHKTWWSWWFSLFY